jgi:molybdate transport system substrate-binding protein
MRKLSLALAAIFGFTLLSANSCLYAAELRILAGGGIAGPLNDLKAAFERAGSHKLTIFYGTTPELIREATSGAAFDAGVVPVDVMKDAAARAKFNSAPTVDVARVGYGVGVRAGAPKPDISTVDAFKQALLAAPSIATVPESAAGAQILRVMARLGITDEIKAKTKALGSPAQVVQAVAQGEAALGLFLANVFAAPGVELAGPFPDAVQEDLVYTSAPSLSTKEAQAAKAFLDYLKTPEAIAIIRQKGMRPG